MKIEREEIFELLNKGYILSLEIDSLTINVRLVSSKGEYKLAIQNFGIYDDCALDYICNRFNCNVYLNEDIPEGDYCPVVHELIDRYVTGNKGGNHGFYT